MLLLVIQALACTGFGADICNENSLDEKKEEENTVPSAPPPMPPIPHDQISL